MLRTVSLCLLILVSATWVQSSSTTSETTVVTTTAASDATTAANGATTADSGGTTTAACADDPNTDCSQYTSLCSNAKYTPLLQQFCPKTCGFCGGGSTVAPTNCVDSSTNCANWNKNGFCDSTFYTCQNKKDYCAKTCNLCTKTC